MSDNIPVLTIDGPSGAGKGTVSRIAAARLGWHYLDSGALYRAVGVAAILAGKISGRSLALPIGGRNIDARLHERIVSGAADVPEPSFARAA